MKDANMDDISKLDRLRQMQFSLTSEMLYQQLNDAIEDFTPERFQKCLAANEFFSETIGGERRYHHLSAKTFMTVNHAVHAQIKRNPYFDPIRYQKTYEALTALQEALESGQRFQYTFQLETTLTVTDDRNVDRDADRNDRRYYVHLPIARGTETVLLEASPTPFDLAEPNAMQRTVYFDALQVVRQFFIRYAFSKESQCKRRSAAFAEPLTPANVQKLAPFLCEKKPHIVFTESICQIVDSFRKDSANPLIIARKCYDYVTQHIQYAFMPDYRLINQLPMFALTHGKGDCGTQALLWISMLRYAGIPATMTSGRMLSPIDDQTGMHDWVAYYIEPYGWIEADPSYGEEALRLGDEKRWHYYFENVDPYRMAANFDIQSAFAYRKIRREDPLDNQSGEIDTNMGGLKPDYTTMTKIVKSEKKIVMD
ncbi:MAG: hypothetical protein PWP51_1595 [Clostridiales bacterium]|jgi:hypothetical protein|nr:hypothetical protein [Clostridiales bacterium]MDN5299042.1 hypothetical protein [Clostridiales bacterium]